ncbi:hypothetical protein K7A41_12580 [Sphingobacterium sp. InxBP1]|uniref:AAA family ATPase n=1 Tax=Sphingobacterium sp. InxBP1 TaxID=2870328 RepID=UPI0022447E8D|nr:AAA family ATPase [Sphingobacterium sp. InxBP1]MCW8312062.1 hypothetical protein [Sphingobacterium sp. InxBP1]
MTGQINWYNLKDAIIENFIKTDFQRYALTAFMGIDFEKGLNIFKYIVESNKDQLSDNYEIFNALDNLLLKGIHRKDFVKDLAHNLESYLKKMYSMIGVVYTANNPYDTPTLSWCYQQIVRNNNLAPSAVRDQRTFYHTNTNSTAENVPYKENKYPHDDFNVFFADGSDFGRSLHFAYHKRNAHSHNNPNILQTNITDFYKEYVRVYLYFTFKNYHQLIQRIPSGELETGHILNIKKLADLSGGAYSPFIENEVKRDNIIQTIKSKLSKHNVLFIEGDDGIGKTTLLHQFIARNPDNCISHFIDGGDAITNSLSSILSSICNQIHFLTKKIELYDEVDTNKYTDESWLKDYFTTCLSQLTKFRNSEIYFIFDGIEEISKERLEEIKENILDFIPYHKSNIRLILSGKQNRPLLKSNVGFDKLEMIVLSIDESIRIYGQSISTREFEEINKICQNNPGKIVFFRDLIKTSAISVKDLTQNLSSDFNSLYNYVWTNYHKSEENIDSLLAIIAFQEQKYDAKELTNIINKPNIDEAKVIDSLRQIPFIRKNYRGTFEYIFDGFKSFAEKKLARYKTRVEQSIINHLINNLQDVNSLILLPEMYKKTGNTDELVKLLDKNTKWYQLLKESEKISVVSRVSHVALQTIQGKNENKYIPTILKYSVLKSSLKDLSQTTVWQHEIATNLVIGRYIDAINLANIAFLKEDKLKMFASIAKAYIENEQKVPDEISYKILELYDDIDASKDFKNIKEAGMEIASLLMYSNPQLAFRLIEELSGSIQDNDNAFDWALAQISLSIHSNIDRLNDVSKEDINSKVYSKIRNPHIKEFADAILHLSENQTFQEIIDKVNQLESTSQKLFLIRNWIGKNIKNRNISEVITLGLSLVVNKSDKYVPKSADYRVFALPLPHISDKDVVDDIIKTIESYVGSIQSTSTTNDLLAIKLYITRAICNFEIEKGEERLLDIYSEIENIDDLPTKCACFAMYANEASKISQSNESLDLTIYLTSAREAIKQNIDKILSQTASHFEIVQNIITNLVRLYPEDAIDICRKLNKSIDRDNAFLETIATYLKQKNDRIETKILDELINSITDPDIQKLALTEIINNTNKSGNKEDNIKFFKYFDKVDFIIDNRSKCLLYVQIISILEKFEEANGKYVDKLENTWKELEKSVNKVDLGFEIAYNFSFLKEKKYAENFLNLARIEKEDREFLLDNPNATHIFSLTIDLALRIFSGLIIKKNYSDEDLATIEGIISSLPSEKQQIKLWSTLILRIIPHLDADSSFHIELIKNNIIPKLTKIKDKNERINAIVDTIPCLYFYDKNLPYIDEIPSKNIRDKALSKICKYLFTKCLPDEEYSENNEGYDLDFNIIKEILALTNKMNNDYFIADQIIQIQKSVNSKKSPVSNQQKIAIQQFFREIADSKLPDLDNIRHKGYQLLVYANALSIQSKTTWSEWEEILNEVKNISNLSDKIFMWISISNLLPNEYLKEKQLLISKSEKSAYELPSFLDTVGRLNMIFETINDKQQIGFSFKKIFEKLIISIKSNPQSPFLRDNYRSILDVVYESDPSLAKTFVNTIDKDSGRQNTGAYLNNHLNLLEFESKLEKELLNNTNEQFLLETKPEYFNKIIKGRLKRLNGTKMVNDKHSPRDLIYQLKLASEFSIDESHYAFSYFIERLKIMYQNTDESAKVIRKSYLELIDVCSFVRLLSIRNSDKIQSLLDIIPIDDSAQSNVDWIKAEVGEAKYLIIEDLIQKGVAIESIALMSNIDVAQIRHIENNYKNIHTYEP